MRSPGLCGRGVARRLRDAAEDLHLSRCRRQGGLDPQGRGSAQRRLDRIEPESGAPIDTGSR